VSLNMTGQC